MLMLPYRSLRGHSFAADTPALARSSPPVAARSASVWRPAPPHWLWPEWPERHSMDPHLQTQLTQSL